MKTRHVLLWMVIVLCCATVCLAAVIPIPGKHNYMGTWIGIAESGNSMYRISLTEKGGTIAYSFVGHEPQLHRVDSWDIHKGKLKIETTPVSPDTTAIVVEETGYHHLKIRAKSKKWGWFHEIQLLRESDIEARLQQLKSAMNQANNGRPFE